ncbi:MAG: hypothetical protein VYA89_00860, partial [Actinomycetota bacterium]|nr:hypothetical protein [Actinomycetota bacterium]
PGAEVAGSATGRFSSMCWASSGVMVSLLFLENVYLEGGGPVERLERIRQPATVRTGSTSGRAR